MEPTDQEVQPKNDIISVRVPSDYKAEIERLATARGLSVADLVREKLDQIVAESKRVRAIYSPEPELDPAA